MTFISQPGKSDLVCSATITVGDAMRKANELAQVLKDVSEIDEMTDEKSVTSISEESIIHQVIGIIRRGLSKVVKPEEEYYSPAEMSSSALKTFVDPLLYKALGWLVNDDLYAQASDITDAEKMTSQPCCHTRNLLKGLSLCLILL